MARPRRPERLRPGGIQLHEEAYRGSHSAALPQTESRKVSVLQLYYLDVEVQSPSEQHSLENVMEKFINKYREEINGTLSGFDRLVFRGSLRRLNFGYWDPNLQSRVAQGMEQYLCLNHILFKDYLDHVKRVSQKVKQASVKPFEKQGQPVQFLRDPGADKEQIARALVAARKVESGLICALSSMELSPSFESGHAHSEPAEILPDRLPIPDPSASGMDVCAYPDQLPFQHSDRFEGTEWLADGSETPPAGRACQVPDEWQLCQVLRQGVSPASAKSLPAASCASTPRWWKPTSITPPTAVSWAMASASRPASPLAGRPAGAGEAKLT
jgi:hypothetical protein